MFHTCFINTDYALVLETNFPELVQDNYISRLISSPVQTTHHSCLTFDLLPVSMQGVFSVKVLQNQGIERTLYSTNMTLLEHQWKTVLVDLPSQDQEFYVVFESMQSEIQRDYILAIDNIRLLSGGCYIKG